MANKKNISTVSAEFKAVINAISIKLETIKEMNEDIKTFNEKSSIALPSIKATLALKTSNGIGFKIMGLDGELMKFNIDGKFICRMTENGIDSYTFGNRNIDDFENEDAKTYLNGRSKVEIEYLKKVANESMMAYAQEYARVLDKNINLDGYWNTNITGKLAEVGYFETIKAINAKKTFDDILFILKVESGIVKVEDEQDNE